MLSCNYPTSQYTKCRNCGGREQMKNDSRLWDEEGSTICYCIKHDLALEPCEESGRVYLANGHGYIECDGQKWKC